MSKDLEVKKILDDHFPYIGYTDKRNEAISQICQLFEQEHQKEIEEIFKEIEKELPYSVVESNPFVWESLKSRYRRKR